MPTKGTYNREKFRKLAARMDSPFIEEAKTAANMAIDELAKAQDLRFSTEYGLGNEDAEEASLECARLRAQLTDAFESVARHETTTKELEETIDRLHERMAEVDSHFEPGAPAHPAKPFIVEQFPARKSQNDWWAAANDEPPVVDTGETKGSHSGPFPWKTLGAWVYGFAAFFWAAMVWSTGLRDSYRSLFLPLLFVLLGVPAFLYLRKVHEGFGWIGVAVKVGLTVEMLVGLFLLDLFAYWKARPVFTTREAVFCGVVLFGLIWFLYSERFFSWVLDEQKRTQFVVFPGAAVILLLVVAWVTGGDAKPVHADIQTQRLSQSPRVKKHHPAPKPTPPPDDPRKLNYDYELPDRNPSTPVFVQASYSPATDRPYLVAAAFQTSTPSDDGSGGGVFLLLVGGGFVSLLLLAKEESKRQRQKKYQKALDEANAPLPQNETGNAGHASMKDLKKRGWA